MHTRSAFVGAAALDLKRVTSGHIVTVRGKLEPSAVCVYRTGQRLSGLLLLLSLAGRANNRRLEALLGVTPLFPRRRRHRGAPDPSIFPAKALACQSHARPSESPFRCRRRIRARRRLVKWFGPSERRRLSEGSRPLTLGHCDTMTSAVMSCSSL